MKLIVTLATAATLALAGCTPKDQNFVVGAQNIGSKAGGFQQPDLGLRTPNPPPVAQATAFARSYLNSIQERSIREKREYCGFFFVDSAGRIQATPARPGTFASCSLPVPSRGQGVFASYHTHGAYGPQYDNEVPSPTDIQSDFALGLDGYISTPGGRVWRVSIDERNARQVCGLGCVLQDPGFVPRNEAGVRQTYTLNTISQRVRRIPGSRGPVGANG